jgi:hypothetical protein
MGEAFVGLYGLVPGPWACTKLFLKQTASP